MTTLTKRQNFFERLFYNLIDFDTGEVLGHVDSSPSKTYHTQNNTKNNKVRYCPYCGKKLPKE